MSPHLPPLIVASWARHGHAEPSALVADFVARLFEAPSAPLVVSALPPETRNGLVLAVLARLFGSTFDLSVDCDACEAEMELALPVQRLVTTDDGGWSPTSWTAPEDVTLQLACPSCGHEQHLDLDPMLLLAHALHAEAHRLTAQVAALGSAYAWPPAVTLALSEAERDRYLELARPA